MPAGDFKEISALIVDPRAHTAKLLRELLGRLGTHECICVATATEALQLLRERRFDVLFCDEKQQDLNPVEFVMLLRRDPHARHPMIPVMLVSNGVRQRHIELMRDSGANAVLVRPISAETVSRKLRALLAKPKPFIAAENFFGPDRRNRERLFMGQERRKRKARKVRIAAPTADATAE